MSATILTHPRARRFIAVVGGEGGWHVCAAIGERVDLGHDKRSRTFDSLAEARPYAAKLAKDLGLEVKLRPMRAASAGDAV
jgi:hypothetical protein